MRIKYLKSAIMIVFKVINKFFLIEKMFAVKDAKQFYLILNSEFICQFILLGLQG